MQHDSCSVCHNLHNYCPMQLHSVMRDVGNFSSIHLDAINYLHKILHKQQCFLFVFFVSFNEGAA